MGPLVGAEMNRWMDWLIVVMKQRRGSKDETDKYIIWEGTKEMFLQRRYQVAVKESAEHIARTHRANLTLRRIPTS